MLNLNYIHPADRAEILKKSQAPFLCEKTLGVQSVENAVVCPGHSGGVWANGAFLPQSILQWDTEMVPAPENAPEIAEKSEESVVFVGVFLSVWGHEITDSLRHFWFYWNAQWAHLKNLPLVFALLWENTPPSPNFWLFLESLGIPKTQMRQIMKPTQFARVYVPDECFFLDQTLGIRRYTPHYLDLISRVPQLPKPEGNFQKIYFSRLVFSSLKDFNEKAIETFFKNQGFTIVYPEKISFLEELAILQHCEIFAATEGSIAHNMLFARHLKTLLLLRKCRHFADYQIVLNSIFPQLETVYIDISASPLANRNLKAWTNGPFFLYESKALTRYFGAPPKPFPLWLFLKAHWRVFCRWGLRGTWQHLDHLYLGFTHPFRAKLKIGTRLRQIFKKFSR